MTVSPSLTLYSLSVSIRFAFDFLASLSRRRRPHLGARHNLLFVSFGPEIPYPIPGLVFPERGTLNELPTLGTTVQHGATLWEKYQLLRCTVPTSLLRHSTTDHSTVPLVLPMVGVSSRALQS